MVEVVVLEQCKMFTGLYSRIYIALAPCLVEAFMC